MLTENFVPIVVLGCLVVGYIIKHSFNFIPNKYIPTILGILDAVLNCAVKGVTIDTVVYGAVMGLASTGLHQAFTKFVENTSK